MKEVLSAGYVALDLISYAERLAHRAGGTAANVAANLAFLGWEARLAGTIGHDAAGRAVRDDLRKNGVHVDDLELRSGGGTPVVLHEIRKKGHRFYFRCADCGRRFPKFRALDEESARSLAERSKPDVFFFDRASKATAVLAEELRKRGTVIVFEPSTIGREFNRCLHAAHIFKYSSRHATTIEPLRAGTKPTLEISTDGKSGVRVDFHGESMTLPAFEVAVIDAAGAGDWTTAGLLWRLIEHPLSTWSMRTIRSALQEAQALAAISCAYPGARAVTEHLTRSEMLAVARQLVVGQKLIAAPHHLPRSRRPSATGCASCLAEA